MAVRTLGPGSLKIGATGSERDFSADVINTALEPSTSSEDNDNFLDGHTEGGSQTESWTLTGTIKEDFSTGGVQAWCLAHSGETMPFTWIPNTDGSLKLTGSLIVSSIKFGGDVKTKNSNDFSFTAFDIEAHEANVNLLQYGPASGNNLTSTVQADGSLLLSDAGVAKRNGVAWTFPFIGHDGEKMVFGYVDLPDKAASKVEAITTNGDPTELALIYGTSNLITFTVPDGTASVRLSIIRRSTDDTDKMNGICKIQLQKGSTLTDWEKPAVTTLKGGGYEYLA
ncbi:hypothetical protein [Bifidobacterium biavatii]|uniref:Uncharacterized protein n=1 Tax=Bifidobacterium biavatii DSM 23969 TaxID=1437608 RepID=A0A087A1H7_9BIFI|nr:hypothetical protein [Bifidobacterium biavatii]KFI52627.1 hypothetical protein BBIA_0308 [Bifidobacterium biavatii DSM 23969]